jgi:hypothetical protein
LPAAVIATRATRRSDGSTERATSPCSSSARSWRLAFDKSTSSRRATSLTAIGPWRCTNRSAPRFVSDNDTPSARCNRSR